MQIHTLKLLILVLSTLSLSSLLYAELPQQSLRPGGIAVIPLTSEIKTISYQNHPILITQRNQQNYAVFGIPLSAPIGTLQLETNHTPIQLNIQSYPYAEQRLNVKNQDYVNPNQTQLDRYAVEAAEQNNIYNSFTPSQWNTFPSSFVLHQENLAIPLDVNGFLMVKNEHLIQDSTFLPPLDRKWSLQPQVQ